MGKSDLLTCDAYDDYEFCHCYGVDGFGFGMCLLTFGGYFAFTARTQNQSIGEGMNDFWKYFKREWATLYIPFFNTGILSSCPRFPSFIVEF